jgi:pyruvate carboxylase
VRAGLVLPPTQFAENLKQLTESQNALDWSFGAPVFDDNAGMASIMYPKVHGDYLERLRTRGHYFRHLPTPQALYGCAPGEGAFMLKSIPFTKSGPESPISISLDRIGPLKNKHRVVYFTLFKEGSSEQEQYSIAIKDASGGFEFEGPMADSEKANELGSPMPGVIEKLLVASNDSVMPGDTLAIVSAMKMEVKITAPDLNNGEAMTVAATNAAAGDQVIEGALVITLK